MILSHMRSCLREFVKTHVILTPGALLVGCGLQFVLQKITYVLKNLLVLGGKSMFSLCQTTIFDAKSLNS